ncbi:MAG: A/G-specific adenine glycosylase [Gammaproteobacteria bacterium]|nr:A/G-specific adenine glycosylase [Gammaproteobacteria bacterium]MYC25577.1 A/G-specific adenine glycosylase [Gammaproteobacteria bacterium]
MTWFTTQILRWSNVQSRTDLPWQENRSAYRVWVSEIMLQQTQVATVINHFGRFIEQFPDVFTLQRATSEEILAAWYGLGYYRRALNLHRTADVIVKEYSGEFPKTVSELRSLPGIGRSTAGSIVSAVWNEPAAILDANVRRVLSRFHGVNGPEATKISERELWKLAESHTSIESSRDYNQGIMDFGALWCKVSNPKCNECLLNSNCVAYQTGQVSKFPAKKRNAPLRCTTFRPCVVFDQHFDCLLRQRESSGTYAQMWDTPELGNIVQPQTFLRQLNLPNSNLRLFDIAHTNTYRISNQQVTEKLAVAKYNVPSKNLGTPSHTRWTPFRSLKRLGLPVRAMQRIQLAKSFVENT